MLTLGDIQNSSIANELGYCPTSTQAIQIVNELVDRLVKRGDWVGMLVPVKLCVNRGCVTFPRWIGRVRALHSCRHQIPVRGVWYEFLEYDHFIRHRHHYGHERIMTAQQYAPTYQDIYGPNCTVRVYPQVQADIGATVQIFGVDNNNQPLQTVNADGTVTQGLTITVASPFGSTGNAFFVSRIDRVVKSLTQGNLTMFAYDTVNNWLWDLAIYEPSETNPSYQRWTLRGPCCNPNPGSPPPCPNPESVIALAKLKQIPMKLPSDMCVIDNLGALKLGVIAMKQEEATKQPANLSAAVYELNRQLEDQTPDIQVPISEEPFQGVPIGVRKMF